MTSFIKNRDSSFRIFILQKKRSSRSQSGDNVNLKWPFFLAKRMESVDFLIMSHSADQYHDVWLQLDVENMELATD